MLKISIEADRMGNPEFAYSRTITRLNNGFRKCVFVVSDECTMANKIYIEAVNRILRDSRSNNQLFRVLRFFYAEDFRQISLVFIKGTRADEVKAF